MSTYQEVADLARLPLNDVDKVRFPDSTLHLYAVHGMQAIFKRRADLFVGQLATPPLTEAADRLYSARVLHPLPPFDPFLSETPQHVDCPYS